MSEERLIRNCAPTLAGLKTGSMFACPMESRQALTAFLRSVNRQLGDKGVRILPLRCSEDRALLYLYRPEKLRRDLSEPEARQLLRGCGYDTEPSGKCLVQLICRFRTQPVFPHEVGLFLGYPPEDVRGFIEKKADGCKCSGCWKVYGDPISAEKCFAQYRKCTQVYTRRWAEGKSLVCLTVPQRQ